MQNAVRNVHTRLGTANIASDTSARVNQNANANLRWQAAWSEYLGYRQASDEPVLGHMLLAAMVDVVDTTRADVKARQAILKATPEAKTYAAELSRLTKLAQWQLGLMTEVERVPDNLELPLAMAKSQSISTVYRAWSKAVRADLKPELLTEDPAAISDAILRAMLPDEAGKVALAITVPVACRITMATGQKAVRNVVLDATAHPSILKGLIAALTEMLPLVETPGEDPGEVPEEEETEATAARA